MSWCRLYWTGVALAVLLLAGCSGRKAAEPTAHIDRPAPSVEAPGPDRPGHQPGDPGAEERSTAIGGPRVVTPPGSGDWTATRTSAQELASRVDRSLKNLRHAYAGSELLFDIPEGNGLRLPAGRGMSLGNFRIENENRFNLQYVALAEGIQMRAVRNLGQRTELLGASGWTPQEARGPVVTLPASDEEFLRDWPLHFSKSAFSPFLDGVDFWQRTIGAWERGVRGFRLTTEERPATIRGEKRVNYRVHAERSEGEEREAIEVLFDGERNVPITIRVESFAPDRKPLLIQWHAAWAFDMEFAPGVLERVIDTLGPDDARQRR